MLCPTIICSARVMRNEQGESRGFGFVSYQTPDQGKPFPHTIRSVADICLPYSLCCYEYDERDDPWIETIGSAPP